MPSARLKLSLFRGILLLILITAFEAIGYLGLWANSRSFDFLSNKNYFQIRGMLMGNKNPEWLPRYLTLPYLGYIPYPGYKKHGIVQHSEDGYRGEKVPLEKMSKFRVLCLGGSTTYGFGVDSPMKTFPAQLEVLLNNYITHDSILTKKYAGAEVINAGLEGGTSAEELQQYLFKYKYYHADAIIIHSGLNDAMLIHNPADFQLDYTHYRRINFHLEPLSQPMRWLFKSYFVSYLSIRLFYNHFSVNGDEFKHQGRQTFCKWSHLNIDSVISMKEYDYYPFYQNSRSLYQQIINDGSALIVFPNALNKNNDFVKSDSTYTEINSLNISISQSLCNKFGGIWISFSFDSIKNSANWIDDCHVNTEGEREKAEILLPALIKILYQSFSKK